MTSSTTEAEAGRLRAEPDDRNPAPIDPEAAAHAGPWALERTAAPADAAGWAQEGSLFALADGLLGVRAGLEERDGTGEDAFLNTVFDATPITYHERFKGFAQRSDTRVPVADAVRLNILAGGIALGEHSPTRFFRRLDLQTGELVRRTVWDLPSGRLALEARRAVAGGVLAIRLTLASEGFEGPLVLTSWLRPGRAAAAQGDDPRMGAGSGARLETLALEQAGADAALLQHASHAGIAVACALTHASPDLRLDEAACGVRAEGAALVFTGRLATGGSVRLDKLAAYAGGPDAPDAYAAQAAERRRTASYDGVRDAEAAELAALWRMGELHAGDDADLTRALRFNLLQLWRSAPSDGASPLAAKGLTGEGYEGHAFWDSEVFALPVLALTAPERALSQLRFRAATLDRARAHARELDFAHGALYPWRTIAGDEGSAYFPSGSAQLHVNADIAWAVRFYDRATGDDAFVLGEAAPMVWETARIWLQAGFHDPRAGDAFKICGVTGPDEYSAIVDDDHYTNRLARLHLRYALELADRAPADAPSAPDARERAAWARAAELMHLPVDARLGVHPQDAGFLGKPPWRFREDGADRPLLLHHHPLTLYRHQVLKQASVVQAHAMDPEGASTSQMRRDLDYYAPLTAHDSTLSACAHAVVSAATGRTAEAVRFLRESALVDLDDLHGNAAHGLHFASMAGGWQAVAMGLAGLRIADDGGLAFLPQAPPELPAYGFGLLWRGARLRVEVGGGEVAYAVEADGAGLALRHDGEPLVLAAGDRAVRPVVRLGAPHPKARFAAMIFDLDGVLVDTARAHFQAWKAIADEVGAPFDEAANEALKGVDRMGSLDLILARAPRAVPAAEREALAERKNAHYRRLIARFGPGDLLPGAREALDAARARGLALALASASRNAPELLDRLGIAHRFDAVVDPATLARGKPDPEIFLRAAAALRVAPGRCLGVEDAQAGVTAIKAAGMTALGVGDAGVLTQADRVVADLSAVSWSALLD